MDGGPKVAQRELVTGSLNSCDEPGKSGWGKLMFNSLLWFISCCATEQGTFWFYSSGPLCLYTASTQKNPPLINTTRLSNCLCCNLNTWCMLRLAAYFSVVGVRSTHVESFFISLKQITLFQSWIMSWLLNFSQKATVIIIFSLTSLS